MANYRMHTLHCARNVALCPRCDEPFPRSQMEEHVREEHTDAECRECGAAVQRSRMGEHKVKTRFFFKKKQLGKRTLPASDVGAGENVLLRQVMLFIQREKNNLPYYFVLYCRAKKCFLQFYFEFLAAHLSWSFCRSCTVRSRRQRYCSKKVFLALCFCRFCELVGSGVCLQCIFIVYILYVEATKFGFFCEILAGATYKQGC